MYTEPILSRLLDELTNYSLLREELAIKRAEIDVCDHEIKIIRRMLADQDVPNER